jgi:hypothetical protein
MTVWLLESASDHDFDYSWQVEHVFATREVGIAALEKLRKKLHDAVRAEYDCGTENCVMCGHSPEELREVNGEVAFSHEGRDWKLHEVTPITDPDQAEL